MTGAEPRRHACLGLVSTWIGLVATAGCADGVGDIEFRAAGGTFVEDGISASSSSSSEGTQFLDGWEVEFDRYVMGIGEVTVDNTGGGGPEVNESLVLTEFSGGAQPIATFEGLDAQRWDNIGWSTRAPTESDDIQLQGATQDEADRMITGGYASLVSGRAVHLDGREVTFDWAIPNGARSDLCANGSDGTDGLIVRAGGTNEAEITLHAEHMFWDTVGIEALDLRFEAIAAVAGPDGGHVEFEDLTSQKLTDLRDADGDPLLDEEGFPLVYVADVDNLRDFIIESTRRQMHLNGGGLCGEISPL